MKKLIKIFLFPFQLIFYYLLFPIAKLIYCGKKVFIVCERGDDARDNGYHFFKYLCENKSEISSYYLIDKKSVDYSKVKKLGKVVSYKSFKHWLLYCAAKARLTTHLAAFAPTNYLGEWFKHHKQSGINVFLQHGITHNEFPSNYYEFNGSDIFVCGAKPEYDHILKNCHYPDGNVVYTGFARFDNLHNAKTKKQILIMPSWRSYLYQLSNKDFEISKCYQTWISLLSDTKLIEYCREKNIKIIFYPHYEMQKFVSMFKKEENDVLTVADFNHFDVQTLLMESSLLITDYSSILFDFAYMRKPQLLFQFDENEFYGKHYKRSYFDHRRDGFGKVVIDVPTLVNEILDICNVNFKLEDFYKKNIEDFFPLYDQCNSKRIFDSILNNKKF